MANEQVDKHALNHLVMWIENDGDLYRQQFQPILKNLVNYPGLKAGALAEKEGPVP